MNKTEYIVYWTDIPGGAHASSPIAVMTEALALAQKMRNSGMRFVTMASESVENVGKMGVDSVVDGKCPDGGDFLGRTSRHGMQLLRGR